MPLKCKRCGKTHLSTWQCRKSSESPSQVQEPNANQPVPLHSPKSERKERCEYCGGYPEHYPTCDRPSTCATKTEEWRVLDNNMIYIGDKFLALTTNPRCAEPIVTAHNSTVALLTERIRDLEGDKARMDWLEKNASWHDPHNRMKIIFPMETVTFTTVRAAIDTAILEEKEAQGESVSGKDLG